MLYDSIKITLMIVESTAVFNSDDAFITSTKFNHNSSIAVQKCSIKKESKFKEIIHSSFFPIKITLWLIYDCEHYQTNYNIKYNANCNIFENISKCSIVF